MQDFFNLVMLICAALAAMGLGVFAAYGLFKAGFGLMRIHAQAQVSEGTAVPRQQARQQV